jgi:hypothetical protein
VNLGRVYVVRTTLSRTPKDKLTICICEKDGLFFWINTDQRSHGIGQLALAGTEHSALSHDCFLDCSRATTFLPLELRAAQPRDLISAELAARIVQFLKDAPPKTLAPRFLKIAIENLSGLYPPTPTPRLAALRERFRRRPATDKPKPDQS